MNKERKQQLMELLFEAVGESTNILEVYGEIIGNIDGTTEEEREFLANETTLMPIQIKENEA